jgi:4-amino-4-deoxy-L-arabinose transferase-like glycosyltransferase
MNIIISSIISLLFATITYLSLSSTKNKKIMIISTIIIFVGCFIRLYNINNAPVGLNQDEASIGYEAYSLLNYGIDRNGMTNPVHLIAWGSGQNILYAYFIMPFLKIFGSSSLAIRLPMALIGCLTLLTTVLFVKKNSNYNGIIVMLMIAIMPWHIMKSRWGLESNLFPDLIVYGLITFYFAIKNKKNILLIISSIIFGLSVYSYGTSYLYVPVLLIILYIYTLKKKEVNIKSLLLHLSITTVIAIPMILFVIINYFNLDTINFLGMTIPKLPYNRFTEITSVNGSFISNCFNNLITSFRLIIFQEDGMPLNYISGFGAYYYISIIFLILGIYYYFKEYRKDTYLNYAFIALISSVFIMMMVSPNINRINVFWLPSYIFIILGIIKILTIFPKIKYILPALYIIFFITFTVIYFTSYQKRISLDNNEGLEEAILSVDQNKKIYITEQINQPYIFWLYYNEISPYDYLEGRIIPNENVMFQQVTRVNNVDFHLPPRYITGITYIIPSSYDIDISTKKVDCHMKTYHNFTVLDC